MIDGSIAASEPHVWQTLNFLLSLASTWLHHTPPDPPVEFLTSADTGPHIGGNYIPKNTRWYIRDSESQHVLLLYKCEREGLVQGSSVWQFPD